MMLNKNISSKGAVSTIFLVVGIVLIILVIVVFVVVKINAIRSAATVKSAAATATTPVVPAPVYQTTIGDIQFNVISVEDLGNTIVSPHPNYQPNLTTTDKFIKVTIGAQNQGKVDLPQYSWSLGNIIDSDGRSFISINDKAYSFLPSPDLCGSLLKPDFAPTPCVSYYEVSSASTGLTIQVNSLSTANSKKSSAILDLNVT